jgi:trans-aconitate methyltransferase
LVLRRYFPETRNFLGVGCATGFVPTGVISGLPQLKLCGSEISNASLAHAVQRFPGVEFFQMDARGILFRDEFDVIGAFDVLEHIYEHDAVLREMYCAAHSGRGIVLTVPQYTFLWSQADAHICRVRRYAAWDLRAKVEVVGFQIDRMTSFVSLLLPLMMTSRARRPVVNKCYDLMVELKISGIVNVVLEKIMDVERLAIRAGLNFPAGGSLLMIAKKTS